MMASILGRLNWLCNQALSLELTVYPWQSEFGFWRHLTNSRPYFWPDSTGMSNGNLRILEPFGVAESD